MKTPLENVMIMLVIGILAVTLADSLGALGGPVTKDEAIRTSEDSVLVKEGMAAYDHSQVEATHSNSTLVDIMKKGHAREIYEKVPEGHGIWKITWTFNPRGGLMIGYTVIVIVDSETGTIVYDAKGVGFG